MATLYFAACPLLCQGLVRPLVVETGELVLMCDECGAVWSSTQDLAGGIYSTPAPPSWSARGFHVAPGTTRWATKAEVDSAAEWSSCDWRTA